MPSVRTVDSGALYCYGRHWGGRAGEDERWAGDTEQTDTPQSHPFPPGHADHHSKGVGDRQACAKAADAPSVVLRLVAGKERGPPGLYPRSPQPSD